MWSLKETGKIGVIVKLVSDALVYTPGANYVNSFLFVLVHKASEDLLTCQMCTEVQPNEVIKSRM